MRAYEIRGGFGIDNLVPVEREDPVPGHGQVRVRIRYASINYRDWLMVEGKYNPRQPLPLIPLSDGAGEIDRIGPGVSTPIGTRVTVVYSMISRACRTPTAYDSPATWKLRYWARVASGWVVIGRSLRSG